MGTSYEAREIPDELQTRKPAWREKMIEAAAEGDEDAARESFLRMVS